MNANIMNTQIFNLINYEGHFLILDLRSYGQLWSLFF